MLDCFYIIESHPGWYQLILDEVFYCISAGGDLDTIVEVMKKYVRKYRTKYRLIRALREVMDNSSVSIITVQDRKEHIYEDSKPFARIVEKAVREALEENKKDTPLARNNAKKKLIPCVGKQTDADDVFSFNVPTTATHKEEVATTTVKVKPLLLRRRA